MKSNEGNRSRKRQMESRDALVISFPNHVLLSPLNLLEHSVVNISCFFVGPPELLKPLSMKSLDF
jgi:hypothetical protein